MDIQCWNVIVLSAVRDELTLCDEVWANLLQNRFYLAVDSIQLPIYHENVGFTSTSNS